MASFTIERVTKAPPEAFFGVITDHLAYPDFTPVRKAELEHEGSPSPNGVGAVRSLSLAGPPMREEVTEFEPPRRFGYRLLSGLPVRDHVGTVTLAPEGAGTRIVYEVETTPTIRPLSPLIVGVLRFSIRQLVANAAKEAERRSAGERSTGEPAARP